MQDLNASLRPLSDPASQPTLLCCFLTVAMPKSSKADPPVLLLSPAELAHKQAGHAEPSSGISLRKSTTTGTPVLILLRHSPPITRRYSRAIFPHSPLLLSQDNLSSKSDCALNFWWAQILEMFLIFLFFPSPHNPRPTLEHFQFQTALQGEQDTPLTPSAPPL